MRLRAWATGVVNSLTIDCWKPRGLQDTCKAVLNASPHLLGGGAGLDDGEGKALVGRAHEVIVAGVEANLGDHVCWLLRRVARTAAVTPALRQRIRGYACTADSVCGTCKDAKGFC